MKTHYQKYIARHGAESIVEQLRPYLSDRRQQRIEQVLGARLGGLQLAIESPADIHNAFACIRSAEALGLTDIHIITAEISATGLSATTQGAFHWIQVHYYESLADFLTIIRKQNLVLAGGVVDATHSLHELNAQVPTCLLMGNEQRGLSAQARAACDTLFTIPLYGMSESLNLSVSAAISVYDMSSRRRQYLQQDSDLSLLAQQKTRAHYYLHSANQRLVETLLK